MSLRDMITHEGELSVSSELNGTGTRRTWEVTVRFRSFNGQARKYGDLTPIGLATLCSAAIDALIEAIRSKNELTRALLQMDEQ